MKTNELIVAPAVKSSHPYTNEVNDAYSEKIFPGEFGQKFHPNEAPLYINKRNAVGNNELLMPSLYYEKQLVNILRKNFESRRYSIVVLTGQEGQGKSSLIRYVVDSKQNFNAKLNDDNVLHYYCDFRVVPTEEDVKSSVYSAVKNSVHAAFPNIKSEDGYKMWQDVFKWNEEIHQDAVGNNASKDEINKYRAKTVSQILSKDKIVAIESIRYLSSTIRTQKYGQVHQLFICDNIDQQTVQMQLCILKTLVYIRNSVINTDGDLKPHADKDSGSITFILPLRPETETALSNDLKPITEEYVIPIGEVFRSEYSAKRAHYLNKLVLPSKVEPAVTHLIDGGSVPVFHKICVEEAKKALRISVSASLEKAKMMSIPSNKRTNPRIVNWVNDFCGGSLRRYNKLKKRLALSNSLAQNIRINPFKKISDYDFFDGLITGASDTYMPHEANNDIINVFNCSDRKTIFSHGRMVGVFILHLLRSNFYSVSEVTDHLFAVGFSKQTITDSFTLLINRQCMVRIKSKDVTSETLENRKPILEAYWNLISEPAYIDNMAYVTPIPTLSRTQKQRIKPTKSYDSSSFYDRIMCSVQFLRQLQKDETEISRTDKASLTAEQKSEFKKRFESLAFPSIYKYAAYKYKKRLRAIDEMIKTHDSFRLGHNLTRGMLGDILEYPVFRLKLEDLSKSLTIIE